MILETYVDDKIRFSDIWLKYQEFFPIRRPQDPCNKYRQQSLLTLFINELIMP